MGQIITALESADVSTPSSGFGTLYGKTDNNLYWKRSDGTVIQISAGANITFKTNGTNNASQTVLNLTAGANITLTDGGAGLITIAASGGGGTTWVVKTSNYTAVAGDNILADTSGGAFTITLPATPTLSDTVRIRDYASYFSINNLTIARNGSLITGLSSNVTVNRFAQSIELVYTGSTYGWMVQSILDTVDGIGFNPADANSMLKLTANNQESVNMTVGNWANVRGTTSHTTGKSYFEIKVLKKVGNSNGIYIGIATSATDLDIPSTSNAGTFTNSYAAGAGSFLSKTGSGTTGDAAFSYTTNDVIGIAFDGDAHTLKFYKNNVLQVTYTGLESSAFFPVVSNYDTGSQTRILTLSGRLTYTPPAGYSAWES